MSDNSHEEADTGPIKNPKQLLVAVFFSFVVPIFAIIGLVYYVVSDAKPSGSTAADSMALGGVSQQARDKAVAERLQKVGAVEIRDANRELKTGEDVFKAQCINCHGAGLAGSPKFGDAAAWAPRIKQGFDTLLHSAIAGKGAMGAQGGGEYSDFELGRAVVHMVNNSGGKLAEPPAPAPAASAASAAN